MTPLRFLFAFDGGSSCDQELRFIRPPLVPAGSVICVLRCGAGSLPSIAANEARRISQQLERRGYRAYSRVERDASLSTVVAAAVRQNAERVIVRAGRRRRGGFPVAVASKLSASGFSVLALPGPLASGAVEASGREDVLFVLNGSPGASRALAEAAARVKALGANLHVLQMESGFARPSSQRIAAEDGSRHYLDSVVEGLHGLVVVRHVRRGGLGAAVRGLVAEHAIGLVMMARPAPSRLSGLRRWDPAYLRDLSCPLVVSTALQPELGAEAPGWTAEAPTAHGLAHIGMVRKTQDDRLAFDEGAGIYAVADGVASCARGGAAASAALEGVLSTLRGVDRAWAMSAKPAALHDVMRQAFRVAALRVVDRAGGGPDRPRIGTTLTVAWLLGDRVVIGHLGDSRVYLSRAGHAFPLTVDHTLPTELAQLGAIPWDAIADHPMSSLLTRTVNSHRLEPPDVRVIALEAQDRLLLCTDGLTRHIPDDRELQSLLGSERQAAGAAEGLLATALGRGGLDNIALAVLGPMLEGRVRRQAA